MLVFLVVGVLTSQLASSYRGQQTALRQSELRSGILLSVSHDLRTPLASIIGALSTLQSYQEKLPVAEKDELLQSALDESHRLHRYIENLLQATKIHHQVSLNASPQPVTPILQQVLQRFNSQRLVLNITSTPPHAVSLSSALFEQALYNIIDNALRYSPDSRAVNIEMYVQLSKLCIEISDKGQGIPLAYQEKVFEPFYSSRQGDTGEGGIGLGLAVAKAIIEAHQGILELIPTEQGCCMRITLPIVMV